MFTDSYATTVLAELHRHDLEAEATAFRLARTVRRHRRAARAATGRRPVGPSLRPVTHS